MSFYFLYFFLVHSSTRYRPLFWTLKIFTSNVVCMWVVYPSGDTASHGVCRAREEVKRVVKLSNPRTEQKLHDAHF